MLTSGEMPAFGTETILVVDDEEVLRDLFEQTLIRSGYEVFTAENGNKALEIYREKMEGIDLVILDLIMPEMGGEECLDGILEIDPNARVLIASGQLAMESRKAVLERRARGFIDKPCNTRELLRKVRKVLEENCLPGSRVGGDRTIPIQSAGDKETIALVPPLLSEASLTRETPGIEEFPRRLRILAIDDRVPYLKMLEAGVDSVWTNVLHCYIGQ